MVPEPTDHPTNNSLRKSSGYKSPGLRLGCYYIILQWLNIEDLVQVVPLLETCLPGRACRMVLITTLALRTALSNARAG